MQDPATRTGIYEHPIIQELLNITLFANKQDEGIVYAVYFQRGIASVTISLILTIVRTSLSVRRICTHDIFNSGKELPWWMGRRREDLNSFHPSGLWVRIWHPLEDFGEVPRANQGRQNLPKDPGTTVEECSVPNKYFRHHLLSLTCVFLDQSPCEGIRWSIEQYQTTIDIGGHCRCHEGVGVSRWWRRWRWLGTDQAMGVDRGGRQATA